MLIPESKLEAVHRALGGAPLEAVTPLTQGVSGALVFRVVTRGQPRLLRIVMRENDVTTGRHFQCLRAAAEAGLAPAVRYASFEDRVCVTDFIPAVPCSRETARELLPQLLRRLQQLPAFPEPIAHLNTSCTFLLAPGPARDGFLNRVQGLFPPQEMSAAMAFLKSVTCAKDAAPSHNDLKPENMLFDGERLWLVDWEAAFQNDRYNDLAVAANLLVDTREEEELFLRTASGTVDLTRFREMRTVAHLFHALAYVMVGSARGTTTDRPAPPLSEVWAGALDMETDEGKLLYGRAHWKAFLHSI